MYITGELLLLYHSAWCATYQDFTLFVSIFLFSARGRGKRNIEKPSFSALLFSFFLSRVYCHVIPHRVLLSRKNLGESCIRTWLCWSSEATENRNIKKVLHRLTLQSTTRIEFRRVKNILTKKFEAMYCMRWGCGIKWVF